MKGSFERLTTLVVVVATLLNDTVGFSSSYGSIRFSPFTLSEKSLKKAENISFFNGIKFNKENVHMLSSGSSNDNSDTVEIKDDSTQGGEEESKSGRGFKNALIMGPPLVVKFLVVLVVKVLTDVVVFPLLYSYRFVRLVKKKMLELLGIKKSDQKPSPEKVDNKPEYEI